MQDLPGSDEIPRTRSICEREQLQGTTQQFTFLPGRGTFLASRRLNATLSVELNATEFLNAE